MKVCVSGLARMSLAVILVVLFSCSTPGRLDIPAIGYIGDMPSSVKSLEIHVSSNGDVKCNGRSVSVIGLCEVAKRCVLSSPGYYNSSLEVKLPSVAAILHVDQNLPWEVVARIRQILVSQNIYRIFLAGVHSVTGRRGVLALYHPIIIGASSEGDCVEIDVGGGDNLDDGLRGLYSSLAKINVDLSSKETLVQVVPRLSEAVRSVVYVIDMLFRAGAQKVYIKDDWFWAQFKCEQRYAGGSFITFNASPSSSIVKARLVRQSLDVIKLDLTGTAHQLPIACPYQLNTVGTLYEGFLGDSFWEEPPSACFELPFSKNNPKKP